MDRISYEGLVKGMRPWKFLNNIWFNTDQYYAPERVNRAVVRWWLQVAVLKIL